MGAYQKELAKAKKRSKALRKKADAALKDPKRNDRPKPAKTGS